MFEARGKSPFTWHLRACLRSWCLRKGVLLSFRLKQSTIQYPAAEDDAASALPLSFSQGVQVNQEKQGHTFDTPCPPRAQSITDFSLSNTYTQAELDAEEKALELLMELDERGEHLNAELERHAYE